MKEFKFEGKQITMNLKHKDIVCDLTKAPPFDPKLMDPSHPFYMIVKIKKHTEAYLNAITDCFKILPKGLDVLEFCGGMGLVPESLWDLIEPNIWTAIEFDQACIDARVCHRLGYNLEYGDMYNAVWLDHPFWKSMFREYNFVHMDWPTNTLRKFWADKKVSDFMDRLFAHQPRFVGITDIECGWIHLQNHWPHYAELFRQAGLANPWEGPKEGRKEALREGYTTIFGEYVKDRWGYKVINRTCGGGGEYFLLEKA